MIKENKTHFCLLKENDLIVGRFFFFFNPSCGQNVATRNLYYLAHWALLIPFALVVLTCPVIDKLRPALYSCWKQNQMILEKNVTHRLLTFSTFISISILRILSLFVQKHTHMKKKPWWIWGICQLTKTCLGVKTEESKYWTCVEKAVDKAHKTKSFKKDKLRNCSWTGRKKVKIHATRTLSCFKLKRKNVL